MLWGKVSTGKCDPRRCFHTASSSRQSLASRLYGLLTREPPLTNDQIVEELTLTFLCAYPTAQEKPVAVLSWPSTARCGVGAGTCYGPW